MYAGVVGGEVDRGLSLSPVLAEILPTKTYARTLKPVVEGLEAVAVNLRSVSRRPCSMALVLYRVSEEDLCTSEFTYT